MKKRTVALLSLAVVVALVAATLLVLRTRWAGERICALAAVRAEAATGLPLSFRACRVDPLALGVEVEGVRLGPPGAPVLTADAVVARLATIQALGGRVRIAALRLTGPRLVVRLPEGDGGPAASVCPPALLSRLEVRELDISGGSLDVSLAHGVRIVASRLDLRARPAVRPLRDFAAVGRTRLELEVAQVRVDGLGDRPFTSSRAAAVAELALDLSAADVIGAEGDVDGVRFAVHGAVRELCAPRLDLVATASGPFREVLALARIHRDAPAEGTVTGEGRITGPAAHPDVAASVRLERGRVGWFRAGEVRGDIRILPGALVVDRAEWPLHGGTVVARGRIGLEPGVPIVADVETGGADLADVLERVGVEGSWVTVKLDAKGKVAGSIVPPRLTGALSGEFRELRTYTQSWRTVRPATTPVLEVKRGDLETPVEVTDERIAFLGARVGAGRGTSMVEAIARFSQQGGFQVRWDGQVDLDTIGKIAQVPCGGLAQVQGTAAAAPYGNPRIVAHARAEDFRYLDIDLGNGGADLDYGPHDFVLRIREAEGVRGQTRWRGEAAVDLGATPARVVSSRFAAKGRVRDVFDAVQDWLPRTRQFRDAVQGDVELSGSAAGPAGALDGAFDARMATGTFYGRPFDSGRMTGTFHRGQEAHFERAELRRGSGVLRMNGRYGFAPPFPWDLDVSAAGVALGGAGVPGEWGGSGSGTAAVRGSFEHPDVRFAANGDAVTVGGFSLGTLQAAGTIQERRVIVTGGADGLTFEGEATLEGRIPFRARADLALEDVARLLPGGAPAGIKARLKGEVTAAGEVEALDAVRASVRLDEVQVGHADLRVHAARPVVLTANRGRVEVDALTLVGPNTELTVSGARTAAGQLDLSATGTLDLRLLAGVVAGLKRPHGQLGIEAHVSGTLADPVLVGGGRLQDAGVELKGASTTISEVRGALAFSQNRVLFEHLSAAVNGGRATLRGEIELASLVPVRHRIEAVLDEVPVAVPAHLPATLSGRVEATGTADATTVTGRLHVVRARYTADVDLERSMLELRRRPAAPPRPYDKAGEWLRFDVQLAVDGDARIENDLVRGTVTGELTVTGTLAAPGLVGSLAMAGGSRAQFRGNEFALTHAVLDFTDRNKVEIALDVHGESQVRDYQIFMHAFGPLADPQLTLTSTPPLAQPDIITLLSLGFTRRDATAGGGVSGVATAAAAQALFSASGLDEQVRRFLPRSEVVRDLSVRITSEWSEVSGQVEPRAEFESWFLQEKLRLRYQAPLSGARGQKAQAELRLGRHTAVQYQWDPDNPDVVTGDHGVDLKLRWEWND